VVGDAAGFGLGRRHGRALLARAGPRIGLGADRLERLERLILRWGGVALVAGRFVGVVRAVTPFLAGASGMPWRRLVGFSILGAGAWCGAFSVAGYLFAAALESHLDALGNVVLAIAGGVILAIALAHQGADQGGRPMWSARSEGTLHA
jgi:membrane-associated protein